MALIKGVEIADLHFGHRNTEHMYGELQQVKDYLENNEVHILNLNGDYFDRKLVGSEPAMFYAVSFFSELVEICTRKNIKMRIILGTRSHDLNQVKIMFNHYTTKENLDIKYIEEVTEEEILGLKVLYIPEEYVEDADAYYGEFKKKSYNMIHGHGTWDFINLNGQHNETERTGNLEAPTFVWNEWRNSVKDGFILFGHIHGRNVYSNKIYYPGSFSRWGYGERSAKGFISYEFDTDTKKYQVNIIDNNQALTYEVTSVKKTFKGMDLDTLEIDDIISTFQEQVDKYDNLRIDLSGLSDAKVEILKKYYDKVSGVKIEMTEKKKIALKESKKEEATYKKYDYILKRTLPLPETIKKFMEESGTKISVEDINKIISEEKDVK